MRSYFCLQIVLLGLAAFVFDACSDAAAEEEETLLANSTQQAVVFNAYATRSAGVVDGDIAVPLIAPANEGFGVFAYSTNHYTWDSFNSNHTSRASQVTTLVENRQVSYSSHSWSYFPQIYWPTDAKEKISYFAWAPYSKKNNVQISSAGDPTITYDILSDKGDKVDNTRMFDLMTASKKDVTADDDLDAVTFKFEHALARVSIKARADHELYVDGSDKYTTRIIIKDIQFSGSKFYGSGSYDIAENSWNNLSAVQNAVSLSPMLDSESGLQYEGVAIDNTTPKQLLKDGEYLFLIPTGSYNADDEVDVTFKYDVITYDPNLPSGSFKYTNSETVKLNQVLEQGSSYNLTFTISLDAIDFEANATRWSEPVSAESLDL
jgi:hypothetical protein